MSRTSPTPDSQTDTTPAPSSSDESLPLKIGDAILLRATEMHNNDVGLLSAKGILDDRIDYVCNPVMFDEGVFQVRDSPDLLLISSNPNPSSNPNTSRSVTRTNTPPPAS